MRRNETTFGEHGGDFYITVKHSEIDDHRYRIVLWKRNYGTEINVSIEDETVATALAKHLYDTLKPEYDSERAADKIRMDRFERENASEHTKQKKLRDAAHRKRLRKISSSTPRVHKAKCLDCEHIADAYEFHEPHYECQCGTTGIGEDGRQCDECGKFRSKDSELSCPECENGIDEVGDVVGVEVDGEFIEESELPESKRAQVQVT